MNMSSLALSLLQFRNDVDTEFEKKAFQVGDKDGDGALDWQEVENCLFP